MSESASRDEMDAIDALARLSASCEDPDAEVLLDRMQAADLRGDMPVYALAKAQFDRLEMQTVRALDLAAMRQGEIEMLRGVGCNEDGDGPCGACLRCLRVRAEAAERTLGGLTEWADTYGEMLCPGSGEHDTYGEGVRACKRQVKFALSGVRVSPEQIADALVTVTRERDEARANYRWMVEHAADQKLDGYRELGARAVQAENERDAAIRALGEEARLRGLAEASATEVRR